MRNNGHKKYSCDSHYFNKIDTASKAYVLGLFYTDGNVASKSNRICLGMNDADAIEFVKKELKATCPVNVIKDKRTTRLHYRLNIFDKTLKSSLIKLGCVPSKSKIILFPSSEIVPNHLMKFFILGCFDGDGAIFSSDDRNFTWHFLGTKSMCEGIASYIYENLNIPINCHPIKNSKFLYQMRCWKRDDIFQILSHLYEGDSFKMERKFIFYVKIKELIEFRPTNQYWMDRKRNSVGKFVYEQRT